MKTSTASEAPAFIVGSHQEPVAAVEPLKKFALIGKGLHGEDRPVGFYTTATRSHPGGLTELFGAVSGAY